MFQPMLGDVFSRDDANDAVVSIQHDQVSQSKRAEKSLFEKKL